MGASFCLDDLRAALPGAEISGSSSASHFVVSTDSRTIEPGALYLPLKGESFDGHDFIESAIARGAAAVVIAQSYAPGSCIDSGALVLKVADTLEAYHALARHWRLKVDPFVVAVTGSSGKTTTKEMCFNVFDASRRTHKSQANENNEFGVPKTILSMPGDTEVLVLELAMRGLGQIAQLAATALADVGIITCAGTAHIELLGSRENIARAKCELLEHLGPGSLALLGDPAEHLVKAARAVYDGELASFETGSLHEKAVGAEGTIFSLDGVAGEFHVSSHGLYQLQDAWCAIKAGLRAGLSPAQVGEGLSRYRQVKGRGNTSVTASGALIIDESYNANPDSVKCAITGLADERAYPHARKVVVLGEMAELGEAAPALHSELGRWLKDQPLSRLITVGKMAALIADQAEGGSIEIKRCADIPEAARALESDLVSGTCIMIKGSNSTRLFDLVSNLLESAT
ncbi:MAG: UDP-N-acetylmuramoyl-tripeptide--D-alanyl-D-alanine ligase [Candidatus Obscuribacterales bacterium]